MEFTWTDRFVGPSGHRRQISARTGASQAQAILGCVLLLHLAACRSTAAPGTQSAEPERPPNVLLIYGDDVGFGDVGVYGAELIPTPNLDRLAAEGRVFTDAHCTAATCTPSRFSLLTGVHGFRHGVRILRPNAPLTIPTDALTLPRVFQRAGYRTGIVGKWHLGLGEKGVPVDWNGEVKPGPLEVGFDECFLLPSTNDRVPCVYLDGHRVVGLDPADPLHVGDPAEAPPESTRYPDGRATPEAMTYYASTHGHNQSVIGGIGRIGQMSGGESALWNDENMADEARAFLGEHREEPFFLLFSSQDIHVPRTPHPRFQGTTTLGYRGDAMVQLDWCVGELLDALDEQGLSKETMVIFSSDNGPVYDDGYDDGTTVQTSEEEVDRGHDGSGPYRGGKYQIYEGGTRVPLLVRWPGHIEPGRSSALVTQIDLLASFAGALDVELPAGAAMDSQDRWAAFVGEDAVGAPYVLEEARTLAVREGRWKLVARKSGGDELYDLEGDIAEASNVAAEHPEVAARLRALVEDARERGLRRPR